jgi:putative hydrolase of the HAD superfamily
LYGYYEDTTLGIASYLGLIVTSREVGHEKPHPPIFLAALEQAGAQAAETMYVGDHYGTDVIGAQRVGMKGVLLDRHDFYRQVTDCHRIRTLADLVHCL